MKTSERSSSEHQELVSSSPAVAPCKRKAGRKKFRETRHPVYRGVRERNGGKWVCEVREPVQKTRIWLGTYPTPELAGRAHDVAALALKGEEALLNFPDSAWLVPRAKSCSASDIRTAALQLDAAMKMMGGVDEMAVEENLESPHLGGSLDMMTWTPTGFWDEEAMFNMPGLIDRMAEAMLLTPPAYKQPYFNSFPEEDHSSLADFNLWG